MNDVQLVDITPTPRILRTLGEIPFQPWQCIAELTDNSIDAFLHAETKAIALDERKIAIRWSKDSVAADQRTLEIQDTATGMTLAQMQNAVRAGYSSNDPVNNLGLFGMGFNIATARLGDFTEILSTRAGDSEWVGLQLDFDILTRTGRFDVPVIHRTKQNKSEHGTIIRISRLKSGILDTLSAKENDIRRILQRVYSPLLRLKDITITVRGKGLFAQEPCIWDKSRFVVYDKRPIPAVIEIDHSFGTSFFDIEKNRYLTEAESDIIVAQCSDGAPMPEYIILREKRVYGWIGIQRYSSPNDFGIDFIRNGRKILMSDKSLFSYDNPWTNTRQLQYPVELGSTVGGRIVGELNVDFLLPTYQKNDFDRTDRSWLQLIDFICGAGPYLPKSRKALGFIDPIEAPIPLLANAYRRCDPGTRWLYVPSAVSKQFLREYLAGKEEYASDELWFRAAQEEDQRRNTGGVTTAVNPGDNVTDDIDSYLPPEDDDDTPLIPVVSTPTTNTGSQTHVSSPAITSTREDLIAKSQPVVTLSGKYSFGSVVPFIVHSFELKSGEIYQKGETKPCFFDNNGIDCTFVYDPKHIAFSQYPLSSKSLLLQYLAERIKVRDAANYIDIVDIYVNLTQAMMPETRINKNALQEKADAFFKVLRERMTDALAGHKSEVLSCIFESAGEVEETINALFPDGDKIAAFQEKKDGGYAAMEVIPIRTVIRLIDRFPAEIFDGRVLKTPYTTISLSDENATKRMRDEAKDRMISFLKDGMRILAITRAVPKNELARAAISIDFLVEALN